MNGTSTIHATMTVSKGSVGLGEYLLRTGQPPREQPLHLATVWKRYCAATYRPDRSRPRMA